MSAPITLTLPYPISANRYWRPVHVGSHITIVPTSEAKEFKRDIGLLCRAAGVREPIMGRVVIDIRLYPSRPLDWQKRMKMHGASWDDTVRCLDLDNVNKVLLDAFKGVVFQDDKWVRRINAERMEPDGGEARVIVTITPIAVAQPQTGLFETA